MATTFFIRSQSGIVFECSKQNVTPKTPNLTAIAHQGQYSFNGTILTPRALLLIRQETFTPLTSLNAPLVVHIPFHLKGTLTDTLTNDSYIGFVNDNLQPHGHGVHTTEATGVVYSGNYWNGMKHGDGNLYARNGSVIRNGRWALDVFQM